MSHRRRVGIIIGTAAVITAVGIVIGLGVIGIDRTVTAGTQTRICGVTVGVTAADQAVYMPGQSDSPLAPGDRVRVSPLCVIDVVSIEESELGADQDGGGARVHLTWRLW